MQPAVPDGTRRGGMTPDRGEVEPYWGEQAHPGSFRFLWGKSVGSPLALGNLHLGRLQRASTKSIRGHIWLHVFQGVVGVNSFASVGDEGCPQARQTFCLIQACIQAFPIIYAIA